MCEEVKTKQSFASELETLKSIYVDELQLEETNSLLGSIKLDEAGDSLSKVTPTISSQFSVNLLPSTAENKTEQFVKLSLKVQVPDKYPDEPPKLDISNARGLSEDNISAIKLDLTKLAIERIGSNMLYELIDSAKEFLTKHNFPATKCTICLYDFTNEDVYVKTDCFHHFHSRCLVQYIQSVEKKMEKELAEKKLMLAEPSQFEPDSQLLMPCPVCRLETKLNSLVNTENIDAYPVPSLSKKPIAEESALLTEAKEQQEKFAEIFEKQKQQGGIIDEDAEKEKFLIRISDSAQTTSASSPVKEENTSENSPAINGKGDVNDESKEKENIVKSPPKSSPLKQDQVSKNQASTSKETIEAHVGKTDSLGKSDSSVKLVSPLKKDSPLKNIAQSPQEKKDSKEIPKPTSPGINSLNTSESSIKESPLKELNGLSVNGHSSSLNTSDANSSTDAKSNETIKSASTTSEIKENVEDTGEEASKGSQGNGEVKESNEKDKKKDSGESTDASNTKPKKHRRRRYRSRTKSGQLSESSAKAEGEATTAVSSETRNNSRQRRSSFNYRRRIRGDVPFRPNRGRGRGTFNDGMRSPPYRRNFGVGWNQHQDRDGNDRGRRRRHDSYNENYYYRPRTESQDRPGYFAPRLFFRGRSSGGRKEESNGAQETDVTANTEVTVYNAPEYSSSQSQSHQSERRRGRYGNRNRYQSESSDYAVVASEATDQDYPVESGAASSSAVQNKGRQNYYYQNNYAYGYSRPRNYNARYSYYDMPTNGNYYDYYYDYNGGYNRHAYGGNFNYAYNQRGGNYGYGNRRGGRNRQQSRRDSVQSQGVSAQQASISDKTDASAAVMLSNNEVAAPPATQIQNEHTWVPE